MAERDWPMRYRVARDYADEQAHAYQRGDKISHWTYETDHLPGQPEPRKITLTGAAWVAHAYSIAADNARTLVQVEGAHWRTVLDECLRLATEYREKM